MSTGLGKGIGIPVKLLHEAEGHTVTVRAPAQSRVAKPLEKMRVFSR
jgi:hypothetical protein